ncbi:MAG: response regulator [Treponema sp.]|nr:response regulator [Treponema sp.]
MAQFVLICNQDDLSTPIVAHVREEFKPEVAGLTLAEVNACIEEKKPDIGVVYLGQHTKNCVQALQDILTKVKGIPFILVGTRDNCRRFQGYNNGEEKQFIFMPMGTNSLLTQLKKTLKTLRNISDDEEGDGQGRKHILVVDDDSVYLRTMMNWLKDIYRVSVVKSGPAAITFLQGSVPDLVLLDYEMPEVDGLETLTMIRKLDTCKDVPVLFLTGISSAFAVREAVKLKPQGYILKKIDRDGLILKLKEVFNGNQ